MIFVGTYIVIQILIALVFFLYPLWNYFASILFRESSPEEEGEDTLENCSDCSTDDYTESKMTLSEDEEEEKRSKREIQVTDKMVKLSEGNLYHKEKQGIFDPFFVFIHKKVEFQKNKQGLKEYLYKFGSLFTVYVTHTPNGTLTGAILLDRRSTPPDSSPKDNQKLLQFSFDENNHILTFTKYPSEHDERYISSFGNNMFTDHHRSIYDSDLILHFEDMRGNWIEFSLYKSEGLKIASNRIKPPSWDKWLHENIRMTHEEQINNNEPKRPGDILSCEIQTFEVFVKKPNEFSLAGQQLSRYQINKKPKPPVKLDALTMPHIVKHVYGNSEVNISITDIKPEKIHPISQPK